MKRFEQETLLEIVNHLDDVLTGVSPGDAVWFEVCDPDGGAGLYGGELFENEGRMVRYRGYQCWVDLAEQCGCAMCTPGPGDRRGFVKLGFRKRGDGESFHDDKRLGRTEKYGVDSRFAKIDKLEEPTFLSGLVAAYKRVNLESGAQVLDLGVNSGDEFELLRRVYGDERFGGFKLVGVDHSASAITVAKNRFTAARHLFYEHDINRLGKLDLGRFDLLVSIGTLHSPGIENAKELLMSLVQDHLKPNGAVILGFPNCRWQGGEVTHGARVKNYSHPELSLLFKDVDFCKRYLQQHKFKVTLTGKYYIFLTATKT